MCDRDRMIAPGVCKRFPVAITVVLLAYENQSLPIGEGV
jgi:hypothetical protein